MKTLRFLLLSLCSSLLALRSAAQVPRATANDQLTGTVSFTGIITPTQITANTNDYAPTGFSTAAILRLSTDASRQLTGLAGGATGRTVWLMNSGSNPLVLKNQSSSSTAANRFALDADTTLYAGGAVQLWYDATASRWQTMGNVLAGGGVFPGGKLTIYGTNQNGILITSATNTGGWFMGRSYSSDNANDFFIYDQAQSRKVVGFDGTTDLMSINYGLGISGNLGVGVSPDASIPLYIRRGVAGTAPTWNSNDVAIFEGASGSGATIQAFSDTVGALQFSKPGTRARGYLSYSMSADSLSVGVAGSSVAAFTSTGINNANIGATTPAPGAFTTLSATGDITNSAATGNLYFTGATYGLIRSTLGDLYLQANTSGKHVYTTIAGTNIVDVSGTGVAVTGSLSATGTITGPGCTITGGQIQNNFTGSSSYGTILLDTTNTSGATFASFDRADGTVIGSVTRVTTTNAVTYNTTSDGRLKTNVRDFTAADAGKIIDGLRPRWFDWKPSDTDKATGKKVFKSKKHQDDATGVIGFIAQEENAVDPALARVGAVTVGDENPEKITKQWQRNDAALVPILVAALKDERARTAALEARMAKIEAVPSLKAAALWSSGSLLTLFAGVAMARKMAA